MNKYKKAWILLHEIVANKATRRNEDLAYRNNIYAEISAKMAEILADMMCDEIEEEER